MSDIEIKTDEQLQDEMLALIPARYQKTVGFPVWDILKAVSMALAKIWDTIGVIASWIDIRNLPLEDMALWCEQRRGITHKKATYASVKLQLEGNFTINKGDIFCTENDVNFTVDEDLTANGTVFITATCTEAGTIGNVAAGMVTLMPITIPGVLSVTNPEPAFGGYEEETKDELYNRYIEDLKTPIISGNINHYKKWALECEGVGKAKVKSLWNGDNTVKVVILDQNSQPADNVLIKKVQDYIDPDCAGRGEGQAPTGAYCTVCTAELLNLAISAQIEIKTGEDFTSVKENIINNLKNLLKTIAFDENHMIITYSEINATIYNTDGVKNCYNLLVNNDTDNIMLADNNSVTQVAVIDDANCSIACYSPEEQNG